MRQLVARSKEDILAARGVKPTLSPNLNVLATVEALGVKRLLFIGVGCQVGGRPAPASVHHTPWVSKREAKDLGIRCQFRSTARPASQQLPPPLMFQSTACSMSTHAPAGVAW